VRALDDNSRGDARRLAEVANDSEFIAGDIRDPGAVDRAAQGLDEIHHLAYVNGSQFFYTQPDLVLDVGVRGMVNVIDACRKHGIGKLVLTSSSEVYQTPPLIPTDESAPLTIPDPLGSMIDCPWLKAFLVRAGNFTLHRIARVPMHDASKWFSPFLAPHRR
jgi:nucleoside-diphosphate-sugar epimerase